MAQQKRPSKEMKSNEEYCDGRAEGRHVHHTLISDSSAGSNSSCFPQTIRNGMSVQEWATMMIGGTRVQDKWLGSRERVSYL